MAQGLDHALGAQVAASDADGNHQVHALLLPEMADGVDIAENGGRNFGGKVFPSQEIVSGAVFAFQYIESFQGLVDISFIFGRLNEGSAAFDIYIYHNYCVLIFFITCKNSNFLEIILI